MDRKTFYGKYVFFMATLSTGPFLVPNFTHHPYSPCNTLVVLLSNQTNHTLTATVRITQVVNPPVVVPPIDFKLPPHTMAGINQPLFIDATSTATSITASNNPRALIVTISGDVEKSGNKIQISVTGGFSSDGSSLDFSEATMFFRHEDFIVVSGHHDDDNEDESSDESSVTFE
jgi:hypothetical protein